MRKTATVVALVAACLMFGAPAQAGPGNDPQAWLERMSTAMNLLSYQGTFVYSQGERMETMRITHVSDEDGVRERLVSLSGVPGEVLRGPDGVRWALGDSASVLADQAFSRPFFSELPADRESRAGQSYAFKFGGESLIAGHTARNVKVMPRDHYRYGYSIWLEEHSGLLLKWELVDTGRKPLARLMFTDLRLGSEVDRDELAPGSAMKKYKTLETALPSGGAANAIQPKWKPAKLPPGFQLSTHRYHKGGGDFGGEYSHLVYSDGLATVSVYVESMPDGNAPPEIAEKHGTTHAYGCASGGMRVTVVGDVPAATVEMIGRSVEPVVP